MNGALNNVTSFNKIIKPPHPTFISQLAEVEDLGDGTHTLSSPRFSHTLARTCSRARALWKARSNVSLPDAAAHTYSNSAEDERVTQELERWERDALRTRMRDREWNQRSSDVREAPIGPVLLSVCWENSLALPQLRELWMSFTLLLLLKPFNYTF